MHRSSPPPRRTSGRGTLRTRLAFACTSGIVALATAFGLAFYGAPGAHAQEAAPDAGATMNPAAASGSGGTHAAADDWNSTQRRAGLAISPGRAAQHQRVLAMRQVGREMFLDPRLSASGKQACASCHSPQNHFGPPNDLSVQLGGPRLDQPGTRAVPSLEYIQAVPGFIEHFHDSEEEGDESIDAGPTGGLDWDGRANRGRDQARGPLFSANEMANTDPADLVARVRNAPYAGQLRKLFGDDLFDDTGRALDAVLQSLEAYEQTPEEFYPFNSKFDAYMLGRAKLNEQEMNGLRLFMAADKGNCASCHRFSLAGTLPVFNDYGLIALGVPRNPAIPAAQDPGYNDLGLCGPYRTDLQDRPEYCGLFRSPSLRNVATRHTFFHNGVYHTLKQVLEFYVLRDVQPEKIYGRKADGSVDRFNDLPGKYWDNVNMDPPFGGKPGDKPALSPEEIDDVIAFLGTLTDGYDPARDTSASAGADGAGPQGDTNAAAPLAAAAR